MNAYSLVGIFLVRCVFALTTFDLAKETVIYGKSNKVVICHIAIWSVFRPGRGQFTVDDVDPTLCTHVIFGYAHLNETNDEITTFECWKEFLGDKPQERVSKLKARNPTLKALVCVGGWLDGSIKYSHMAANPKRRQRFVNNAVKFIRENEMDGMDLIWQYPNKRGGSPRDKENYVHLLKELRSAFDKYNLTLTACVGSSKDTIDYSYDVPKLSQYLDFMLVHTFDYHGWWSRMTGANSPLKGPDFLNVEFSISYLVKLGADPKKIVLGIPMYARTFTLNSTDSFDKNEPRFGQKFIGHGFEGPYTEEEGFLGYNEVCSNINNSFQGWDVYWDEESLTPINVYKNKMVSYENPESIRFKVRYASKNRLGGIYAHYIDVDDFRGDCGRKYPLLRSIVDSLHRYRYLAYVHDRKALVDSIQSDGNIRYELSRVLSIVLLVRLLVL